MEKIYWRVNYNGDGIYHVLKKIWKKCENPKKEWDDIKKSQAFMWLKTPPFYSDKWYSYFTELGYELFMANSYSIFEKYLDKENINMDKLDVDVVKLNVVYNDEHQIVIKD